MLLEQPNEKRLPIKFSNIGIILRLPDICGELFGYLVYLLETEVIQYHVSFFVFNIGLLLYLMTAATLIFVKTNRMYVIQTINRHVRTTITTN